MREYEIAAALQVVQDGEAAMRFIDSADNDDSAPRPDLILLDLNLPKRTGAEILERIRRSTTMSSVPVIVVTSSDSQQDREEAARLGATRYFQKPTNYDEFLNIGQVIKQVL